MKRATTIMLLCFLSYLLMAADKKECYTKKITHSVHIDGVLDEPIWETAKWHDGFQMYYPYDNKKASQRTQFAVLYDADFVYVAVHAFENEPSEIVKRLTRRDNLDGDWVGVQFDSYNDMQTAYAFSVSVAGTKGDVFISGDGDSQDESWDPIWWVETAITNDGWVAEMKIPFSQFRFVNSYEQTWGLQIERYIQRNEEISLWQPKKRDDPGWVHHYGKMTGLVDIEPKKTFDLYPYVVGSYETYKADEDDPFRDGNDWGGNVGLDGKVGLTNNLTLDFTINPDFGQVEADPSTVNLSGFELFFEEKRPFFIEGNNIIDFPLMFGDGDLSAENMFYSRRIGRQPHHYPNLDDDEYAKVPNNTTIIGAAKITGRTENGLSIGLLETVAAEETAEIRFNETQIRKEIAEPTTNYSVLSLQKDFGQGNTLLSGMLTSTNRSIETEELNYLHKNAYTGGIDFTKYWKEKTWMLSAKGSFSYVEGSNEAITNTQESSVHLFNRPDADHLDYDTTRTSLSGMAGNLFFGKTGGKGLRFIAATYFKSPGYEINDIGYVRHSDDIISVFWAGYRVNKPFSIFKNLGANFNHWTGFDFSGQYLGMGGNVNGWFTFKNNYSMSLGSNLSGTNLSTTKLRGGPAYKIPGNTRQWLWLGSDTRKKLSLNTHLSLVNGFEDYYARKSASLGVTFKPSDNLMISLNPEVADQMNEQQYVSDADVGEDKRYVLATIHQKTISMSLRMNLNLTPELSIQYWGQPFFATGKYSDYKIVAQSKSDEYEKRFSLLKDETINYNPDDETYEIDENTDGLTDYSFDRPDFNTKVFLHNLVLRWEYRPGSVLFLVWNQNRQDYTDDPTQTFSHNVDNMFDFKPHDTFLIKLSYRIGI